MAAPSNALMKAKFYKCVLTVVRFNLFSTESRESNLWCNVIQIIQEDIYLLDWNVSFKLVILAPASSYVLFGKFAKAPALSSMFTLYPFFTNLLTTAGTTATLK